VIFVQLVALLMVTNKLYTCFWLLLKSVTLDDLEWPWWLLLHYDPATQINEKYTLTVSSRYVARESYLLQHIIYVNICRGSLVRGLQITSGSNDFQWGLYQNGPWTKTAPTKTAHKFLICPKWPTARSKTAHTHIQNGPWKAPKRPTD